MPNFKVILQNTQSMGTVSGNVFGGALSLDGAFTVSSQVIIPTASTPGTASAQFQISNDATNVTPSNWTDYGSSQNIAATGNLYFTKVNPEGNWIRMKYLIASGSFVASTVFVVKGPN